MKRFAFSLALLAFLTAGCQHEEVPDGATAGEHGHEHGAGESGSTAFTTWSSNYELFAEASIPRAGEPMEVHAHLTDIRDGHDPLTDGEVTLLHRKDNSILQEVDGSLVRPGIFGFVTGPLATTEGDLLFRVRAGALTDTIVVHHFHGDHDHGQGTVTGGINFTKELAWKARFRVEPVISGNFSEVITTSGEILAMPGEKYTMVAKTDGVILFTFPNLVQGSAVKKGDILFSISGTGLADNNVAVKFNEAKTRFLLSRQNYFRQRKLYAEKVVSERQFREYESRYITDSVTYYSLSGTVSNEGMIVHAPMTGDLHELNVTEGQYVTTGQKLATLSANRVMLLRADLPQQYFSSLESIVTTTFRPAYSKRVYSVEGLSGRLLAKGASVAENNHYMPVYFEVTNDGSLLEGAFAEFYLKTEPTHESIVIPSAALVEEQNEFYVYVQAAGETFEKRYVTIGVTDGIRTVVRAGLAPGERIVTEGAMLVKTASISSTPSHGHQH